MHRKRAALISLVVISLILSSCGSGQLFGPTPTPTSTPTPIPTPTPTPSARFSAVIRVVAASLMTKAWEGARGANAAVFEAALKALVAALEKEDTTTACSLLNRMSDAIFNAEIGASGNYREFMAWKAVSDTVDEPIDAALKSQGVDCSKQKQ